VVRFNRRIALMIGTSLVAASLPLLASPASAVGGPPWEPDGSALGTLTFFNAAGAAITGGSDLTHLFDYAEASTTDTAGGIKATMYFANPTPAQPTGNFPAAQESTPSFTPATGGGVPAALQNTANPLAIVGATEANVSTFAAGHTINTAAGYAHVYQVRLVTTGGTGGGSTTAAQYWDADVLINSVAGTWVETYPTQGASAVATTTTVTAAPASSASQHSSVTLTATVTATDSTHPAGSVEFFQDGQSLGVGTFNATTGVGTRTTSALLPSAPKGTHLTATFTPSNTSTYSPSTSSVLHYTVNPIAKKPSLSGPHRVGGIQKCTESGLDFGVSAAYAWLVSGKKVATGKSYKVAASAYKKALSCSVAVHDGAGPSSHATSQSVTVSLGKALKATKRPTLSGAHEEGKQETVAHGTWSPKASSYSYQWFVASKKIKGATKPSLVLKATERGKLITCHVKAHRTGYATGTATTKGVKVS
jgi:hypothetical protein